MLFICTFMIYKYPEINVFIYERCVCVCVSVCVCVCVCAQLCLTYCDPRDYSPPGSAVHGISQARLLEWAAISSSRGSSWPRDWTCLSYICCIGRQILYCWVIWEAHLYITSKQILLSVVRLYINLYNIYAYTYHICIYLHISIYTI